MRLILLAMGLAACGGHGLTRHEPSSPPARHDTDTVPSDTSDTSPGRDTAPPDDTAPSAPCPADMILVGAACMDLCEAPNRAGAQPLVMYTFDEADAWCTARGKRLCLDREWQAACEGAAGASYPYGDTLRPGVCNDEETWRVYDQGLLNLWPWDVSGPATESLEALLEAAGATSGGAQAAAHVAALYQGEGGGQNAGCVGEAGVFDLVGNVEEWTRRADGGGESFHGSLKGRYWAESRTCQSAVTTHGDGFRFYEIGFRCCQDPER